MAIQELETVWSYDFDAPKFVSSQKYDKNLQMVKHLQFLLGNNPKGETKLDSTGQEAAMDRIQRILNPVGKESGIYDNNYLGSEEYSYWF